MTLPDGNLLIERVWASHEFHRVAHRFFDREKRVATCAVTELNLVRVLMQLGASKTDAFSLLDETVRLHRNQLIPADVNVSEIRGDVEGHRNTTDAYLAHLANKHGLIVATLDRAFARHFPKRVEFVG
jgi:predicted nucleic acid-binding protein